MWKAQVLMSSLALGAPPSPSSARILFVPKFFNYVQIGALSWPWKKIDKIMGEEVFGNYCCLGLSIIFLKNASSLVITISHFNAIRKVFFSETRHTFAIQIDTNFFIPLGPISILLGNPLPNFRFLTSWNCSRKFDCRFHKNIIQFHTNIEIVERKRWKSWRSRGTLKGLWWAKECQR